MGPHLFRYGKEMNLKAGRVLVEASMGPHLFRYGKMTITGPTTVQSKLQWGHIFSDMESRDINLFILGYLSFNGATSFQIWKVPN